MSNPTTAPVRQGDVLVPADHTFEAVNEFVHCPDVTFEDMQGALLAMAGEVAGARDSSSIQWDACTRAIERWQAATGRDRMWPDYTDLLVWLLERLDAAEEVIDAARPLGKRKVARTLSEADAEDFNLALYIASYDDKYPKPPTEEVEAGPNGTL